MDKSIKTTETVTVSDVRSVYCKELSTNYVGEKRLSLNPWLSYVLAKKHMSHWGFLVTCLSMQKLNIFSNQFRPVGVLNQHFRVLVRAGVTDAAAPISLGLRVLILTDLNHYFSKLNCKRSKSAPVNENIITRPWIFLKLTKFNL